MPVGTLALALLAATSCQAVAPSGGRSRQAAEESLAEATSLLQRSLALHAARQGSHEVPLLQRDVQPAETSSHRARAIPAVNINLDLPPEERWHAAMGEQLKALATNVRPLDRTVLDHVDFTPDAEFVAELRGIVKAVNSPKLTLEHMLANELQYEHGVTACTGVLAATSNGTVFHGRNLDLDPSLRDSMQSTTIDVTYHRGGKPLFSGTVFGPGAGMATGYRIGSYSVAQNTRPGCGDLPRNLETARRGGRPFRLLVRRTLQEADTYEEAVHRLAEVPLIAPMYFTVAGAGAWEGALVTRDRSGHAAPYPNVETLSPEIDRWFIVQTNDDTWKPARDDRRPTAVAKLSSMTPASVNAETMLDVMMTEPVLNNGTIFTWIAQPSTGLRRIFLGSDELRGDVAVPAFVSDIRIGP